MNERIKAITDAATVLFLQQGYAKTQISHIAKAVGVSVGTIYLNFVGKKEIMHFVLKSTIDPAFLEQDFERPIKDTLFQDVEQEIMDLFEKSASDFEKNLDEAGNHYSFEKLIQDAFDMLDKYAVGCLFIEKNQFDFPQLADRYKAYRKRFLDTMTRYIERFMEKGVIRKLEQPDLTTVLIVEILSWWAMDMRYTSFETCNIPREAARAVCMDNIISAYKK